MANRKHSVRHYVATIGTRELHFSHTSDTKAVRLVARWVRLFWTRYQANHSPTGSIAAHINLDPETMCVVRRYAWHPLCHAGVRGAGSCVVRQFGPETAREWSR